MNEEAAYQQALDYLYSFIDFSLQKTFRYSPDRFDLGRMRLLMEKLGSPQQQYPIIHVAGTKGKGSVSAFCASALQANGYKVGFYSSPHLQDYAERIRIDGQPIPHVHLAMLVEEIKPVVATIPELTTFEITTALAFLYFAKQGVNAAVFEVGLGGRLDATNVVVPVVSVITSLSYDHTALLGNTLAQIATEKAGIIKTGVPVVLAPQKDEARQVVEKIAGERSAPLIKMEHDYLFAPLSHSVEGQSLLVWTAAEQEQVDTYLESGGTSDWQPVRLAIPLLGIHQVENAATAYAVLLTANLHGLEVSAQAIQQGFSRVSWPARFEVLRRNPPVIIDSAHNRDSALKLRLAMDDYFPGLPVILVFGASEDKDIEGMFDELMPRVSQVIATQSVHPRAMDPQRLVELAHRHGRPAKDILTIEAALPEALRLAGEEGVVLVAGSIFVAAAARQVWFSKNPVQMQFL